MLPDCPNLTPGFQAEVPEGCTPCRSQTRCFRPSSKIRFSNDAVLDQGPIAMAADM